MGSSRGLGGINLGSIQGKPRSGWKDRERAASGEVGVDELLIRALSVGEVRGSQNLRFENDRHAKRMEARPESAESGHRQ
jgi:hypothetical protein